MAKRREGNADLFGFWVLSIIHLGVFLFGIDLVLRLVIRWIVLFDLTLLWLRCLLRFFPLEEFGAFDHLELCLDSAHFRLTLVNHLLLVEHGALGLSYLLSRHECHFDGGNGLEGWCFLLCCGVVSQLLVGFACWLILDWGFIAVSFTRLLRSPTLPPVLDRVEGTTPYCWSSRNFGRILAIVIFG